MESSCYARGVIRFTFTLGLMNFHVSKSYISNFNCIFLYCLISDFAFSIDASQIVLVILSGQEYHHCLSILQRWTSHIQGNKVSVRIGTVIRNSVFYKKSEFLMLCEVSYCSETGPLNRDDQHPPYGIWNNAPLPFWESQEWESETTISESALTIKMWPCITNLS